MTTLDVMPSLQDNPAAKMVFDAIREASRTAPHSNAGQMEFLRSLREALLDRMNEINSQLIQIDRVMKAIAGPRTPVPEKRTRRDLESSRERVVQWMQVRKHQKFTASELVRQFPELSGVSVCLFLKPLIESGHISKDSSQGNRRTTYSVVEGEKN